MTPAESRHLRMIEALEHLETVRNWLNRAPIDEIEAVEKAIGENAPIHEIAEAIALLVIVAADLYDEAKK